MSPATVSERAIRPESSECPAAFFQYVTQAPHGDVCQTLTDQVGRIGRLFAGLSDAQAGWRYAPEKWSRRGVLGHLSDIERVFGFRAATFARNDPAPQPSFDQLAWHVAGRHDQRPMGEVLAEWTVLRECSVALCRSLSDDAWLRRGVAGGAPFTVWSILWLLAGHLESHLEVLHTRYGPWPGQGG